MGTLLTAAGQIPVARGSAIAAEAFRQGSEGIAEGKPILFYVEGTITRDPEVADGRQERSRAVASSPARR